MKKTIKTLSIVFASTFILTSCGGKKNLANEYCECISKAPSAKTDQEGFNAKFKECSKIAEENGKKITDNNESFDYRKECDKCMQEAMNK